MASNAFQFTGGSKLDLPLADIIKQGKKTAKPKRQAAAKKKGGPTKQGPSAAQKKVTAKQKKAKAAKADKMRGIESTAPKAAKPGKGKGKGKGKGNAGVAVGKKGSVAKGRKTGAAKKGLKNRGAGGPNVSARAGPTKKNTASGKGTGKGKGGINNNLNRPVAKNPGFRVPTAAEAAKLKVVIVNDAAAPAAPTPVGGARRSTRQSIRSNRGRGAGGIGARQQMQRGFVQSQARRRTQANARRNLGGGGGGGGQPKIVYPGAAAPRGGGGGRGGRGRRGRR